MNKKISFKVGKENLSGTILYPQILKKSNPAVLFVHGWSSSQTGYIPRAEAVTKSGAICMTFNLRGHGESGGKLGQFSREDHIEDVCTAYDFLVSLPQVDKKRIGIVGASYGGYLSSILTPRRKVRWLVLRAPALYKDEDFHIPTALLNKDDLKIYRHSKINPKDNFALKSLTNFKNDVVLIECENDTAVPKPTIENYKKALVSNKNYSFELLAYADHELSKEEYKKAFINVLTKYFSKWL